MGSSMGARIVTVVRRPPRSLVDEFAGIPSSNIGDMMNRMYNMRSDIKSYTRNLRLLGTAITVNAPEGDNLLFHRAIDLAEPGDVIVVNGNGSMSRALCGEMMYTYAKSRGLAGFVVDGCIRDSDALDTLDFPVYGVGVTPQGPWKFGPGEINVPIACAGVVVFPGDILVGDSDGIVVIRPSQAEEILALSKQKFRDEAAKLANYRKGIFDFEAHRHEFARYAEKSGVVTVEQ